MAMALAAAAAGAALGEEATDAPARFELPQPAQPGGLVAPVPADERDVEGYLARPDRESEAAPTRAPSDAGRFDLGGVRAGVEAGEGAPGVFAILGDGPLSGRAGVVKDPGAPEAPAAARLGAVLAAPEMGPLDLRLGPTFEMGLPDPTAPARAAGTGGGDAVGLETGIDVGDGLSLDARTTYGVDALSAERETPGKALSSPRNTELKLRYSIDW